MKTWTPVKSNCSICGKLVKAGIINWINHYEEFHPTVIKYHQWVQLSPQELKQVMKELSK